MAFLIFGSTGLKGVPDAVVILFSSSYNVAFDNYTHACLPYVFNYL